MTRKTMTLEKLCTLIQMPEPVTKIVLETEGRIDKVRIQTYIQALFQPSNWMDGLDNIKETLGEDKDGFGMLTVMLIAALQSYEEYQKRDINDSIFADTFACFTRFVKEHMESYGCYGFDREWWTVRQLSLKLFRIGTLEYEMISKDGETELSLHIPSDSVLTIENCRASYEAAMNFFCFTYPSVSYDKISCHSWLLAPGLQEILKKDSNICTFQKSFQITEEFPEEEGYREWVYKRSKAELKELPETTTLQRNLKKYLLSGRKLGTAFGYLVEEPFIQ